ncbi:hypothetical protein BST61_g6574 [Cercospora zeina]
MIRTHRPRGYQWTAASEFQQTELFRDIRYEDAELIDDEVLHPDSEDEFPLSERVLKRQRVEKLADGLLNGEELRIHSARIDAHHVLQSLTCCFHKPKFLAQAIAKADWNERSDDEWQDVEDDWDFLKRRCPGPRSAAGLPGEDIPASREEEVYIEEQKSSCQRRSSQRIAKLIAVAPSKDALRKAAALRNRKFDIAQPVTAEDSLLQPCPESIIADSELDCSPDEELVSDCGPSPTPAWTSAMWRRKDCSRDELALSSFSAQSQPVGHVKPVEMVFGHDRAAPDDQDAAVMALLSSASGSAHQWNGGSDIAMETRSAGGTPVTASIQLTQEPNRRRSAPSGHQNPSQARGSSTTGRRRKAHDGAVQYSESVGVKGSSPFLFRKRALRSNSGVQSALGASGSQDMPAPAAASTKTPSKLVHVECASLLQAPEESGTPLMDAHVNHRLPQPVSAGRRSISLRSSLRHEMIASGAEMSQIESDETSQLSESLDAERDEEQLDTSVVEDSFVGLGALEHEASELEVSGHEVSEYQVSMVANPTEQQQLEPQQLWPGTQAMLAQAQHELFTSPEKTDSAVYLGNKSTPQAEPNIGGRRRRPLGALSQEPTPSTQALLQDWKGWSSIKKPRQPGGTRGNPQSPTMFKGVLGYSAEVTASSFEDKARRRSSLRFAISLSQDSTAAEATPVKPSSMPARSTDMVSGTLEEAAPTTWPRPSGKIASSASFSTAISSLGIGSFRSQPSLDTRRSEQDPFKDNTMVPDATTVSLSFGAPERSSVHGGKIKSASQPAPHHESAPQAQSEDRSVWRSLRAVKMPQPVNPAENNEETVISDMSFGPPNVQLESLSESLPSYLDAQPVQQISDCDSRELRSTMNNLVVDVLGAAANFSF